MSRLSPRSPPFPYTTLFRSHCVDAHLRRDLLLERLEEELLARVAVDVRVEVAEAHVRERVRGVDALISRPEVDLRDAWTVGLVDRKSTRLNSSHSSISYAVF